MKNGVNSKENAMNNEQYEQIVRSNESMRDAMDGKLTEPTSMSMEYNKEHSCENCSCNGCDCNESEEK